VIVRERGRQVMRKMSQWRVEQEHDVIRIFYYTRGWQQQGTTENTSGEPSYWPGWLSLVIGQACCPGWETDCLKPVKTWVGVSARMYKDLNSLGDWAKEGVTAKTFFELLYLVLGLAPSDAKWRLVAENTEELKNLVQNQSFGRIVGARHTEAPRNSRTDNVGGSWRDNDYMMNKH